MRLLQNAIMKMHSNEISSVWYLKVCLLSWIFMQAAFFLAITFLKNLKLIMPIYVCPESPVNSQMTVFAWIFTCDKTFSSPFPFSYVWLDDRDNQMNTLGFKKLAALYKQHVASKECQKQGWPETVNEQAVGKNMIT